jgi:hypothetical protein
VAADEYALAAELRCVSQALGLSAFRGIMANRIAFCVMMGTGGMTF